MQDVLRLGEYLKTEITVLKLDILSHNTVVFNPTDRWRKKLSICIRNRENRYMRQTVPQTGELECGKDGTANKV